MRARLPVILLLLAASLLALSACGSQEGGSEALASTAAAASSRSAAARSLPLGDGRISSKPRKGYVYACQSAAAGGGGAGGGGASSQEPWIEGKRWRPSQKISVQGSVHWPEAKMTVKRRGSHRIIFTRDLPVGAVTGSFPISSSEAAYTYDHNPNHIIAQKITLKLPRNPKRASQPSCLGFGEIGVMKNGVLLFDALDAQDRDAVAHEVQDLCDGHPQQAGIYHYHDVSSCLLEHAKGRSTLVGYAADGFGIYVERNRHGKLLTDGRLDACHGRTSKVRWNGRKVRIYHYVATAEYPYTLGCYRGRPVVTPQAGAGPRAANAGPPSHISLPGPHPPR